MDAQFCELNASVTGTKELKEVLENAKFRFYGLENKTTYVYVDEFHRWNKLQQDSLLKALEEGIIRFIGSTTENPYFPSITRCSAGCARSMNFTGSIRGFCGKSSIVRWRTGNGV